MGHSRHLLATVVVTLVLGVAVGSASANRLSVSTQSFRLNWSALAITSEAGRVECSVTLEGTFHRETTAKTAGQLLGYILRPALGTPCTGGTATLLSETLPWHIRYESFTGNLPNITGVSAAFAGLAIGITKGGLPCLLRTEAAQPVSATAIREGGSTVTGVRLDETDLIPATGNVFCRTLRYSLSGTGRFLAANGASFRYSLI
jgi:hypothetical protein